MGLFRFTRIDSVLQKCAKTMRLLTSQMLTFMSSFAQYIEFDQLRGGCVARLKGKARIEDLELRLCKACHKCY